jgi:glutathione S-transferase
MILIGMFDSPFVRRVAVTLNLLEIPFEHRNWSVGKDFELIRRYNPLGRVPTLVLDDGDALPAFRSPKAEFSAPGARN